MAEFSVFVDQLSLHDFDSKEVKEPVLLEPLSFKESIPEITAESVDYLHYYSAPSSLKISFAEYAKRASVN